MSTITADQWQTRIVPDHETSNTQWKSRSAVEIRELNASHRKRRTIRLMKKDRNPARKVATRTGWIWNSFGISTVGIQSKTNPPSLLYK